VSSSAPTQAAALPGRIPIEPGFFSIPDDPSESPRLYGSRCRACGEAFFPRRVVCAKCLHQGCDDIELGPRGTLYTYTYVRLPLFGSQRADAGGYGVGQIDLPEGPRVQAVLFGGPGDFRIGQAMQLELEALRKNKEGQDVMIFRFRPVEA
jgi:uncharacterized OB-fold protein